MYCQHCGNEIAAQVTEEAAAVEEAVSAEVEIARINAEKEITLAKIAAKVTENVVENELVTENAALEAENEVLAEVAAPAEAAEIEHTEPVAVVIDNSDEVTEEASEQDLPPADHDSKGKSESESNYSGYGSSWFYGK